MKNLLQSFLIISALLSLGLPSRAAEPSENVQNYLQVLRSDFNSAKVDVVNGIMKLSEADAKKFWPLYRAYEKDLGDLAVVRMELIGEFVKAHQDGTFYDAKARGIAKRWFKTQRARLDLLEKYHGKIEDSLSAVQAGQFLQIENQVGLFIDMAIASEMPAVGGKPK